MIAQLWILGGVMFFAPLVPPILSPLGFTLTGILVAQKANPRLLSIIVVGVATISAILIWKIQKQIIERLSLHQRIEGKTLRIRMLNSSNEYFKNQKHITRLSLKREKYIETKTGRVATFLFAIFCFLPIIPDIISTRILYKKIEFPYFVLAVIIGKSISHIPFIFIGQTIVQLLGI